MKLSLAIPLLLATSLQAYANSFGQNVTLEKKNVKLSVVLKDIQRQSNYNIFYNKKLIDDQKRIDVNYKNTHYKKVLYDILGEYKLDFQQVDNNILLSRRVQSNSGTLDTGSDIQIRVITGIVKNQNGEPLANVTVAEKETNNRVMTQADGRFAIQVAGQDAILRFSIIGFGTKEVAVRNQNDLQVSLMPVVSDLEEVVVVGFGAQQKAKITGAISTIKMDDVLGDRPVSTTASLLQGVVPGLQVSISSGQPGAGASFNIRGGTGFGTSLTSAMNTAGPLVLIDNAPLNGPLNLIDPNDIETITVLKDAGSAAIYGARSAFGVVLITTKKGAKNQKTQFNYNSNTVFATVTNLPEKATPLQTAQHYIDGGRTSYYGNQDLKTWIDLLNEFEADPSKYPDGYTIEDNVYYKLAPNNAVQNLLGNNSTMYMQNLSVNGGTEKTSYRFSFGSTNEKGILVPEANQDRYKRYTLKSIVTTDITPWFTTQVDANYFHSHTTTPSYANAFGDATNIPSFLETDMIPGLEGNIASARYMLMNTEPRTNRSGEVRLTGRAILRPLPNLTITGEYTFDNIKNLVTSYDKIVAGQLNPYILTPASYGTGKFSKNNNFTDYQTINIFGSYGMKLNKHNGNLMLGFNQELRKFESVLVSKADMINSDIPAISTGIGVVEAEDNYSEFSTRGFFGRYSYDYDSKYLVELNGRYDGSSRFPTGHRWGFFPSASIGWRITQESFMDFSKNWLDEFKVKASYGTVGNQNIGEYSFFAGMNPTQPTWLNTGVPVTTVGAPGLISPDFTWETVVTKNLGFNIALLKNRLSSSVDIYERTTKDILSANDTPLPSILGTGAPLVNAASLRTNGFEVDLNWKDKVGNVSYYLGANLYNYKSIVTKIFNPNNLITQLYVGKNMGEIWGYTTDRFFTVDDFEEGTLNASLKNGTLKPELPKLPGQTPNPGDLMYVDRDGNGIINTGSNTLEDTGDRTIIGDNIPKYQFGFRGGASYKNFDFSFVMAGVGKQDQWRANQLTFPNFWQTYGALYSHQLDYWTAENTDAYYGRIYADAAGGTAQANNQVVQTRFLLNGAYLRVQNLTLRYRLADHAAKKLFINKLSISCSVENPFTFDNLPKGMFSDIASIGGTAGGGMGYPFMRKWSLGLNLTL
ncbi:SusC/RagA family TonB-linked outer membrane protein [Sphingobacterium lumbrici]|uniref:SusC/RagA family TonB-linked outer membrane protein n=1 Tax=Sphingobacterium lumbrici TaxID=2559600 RepID=UPI0015E3E9E3|nr:TonB-dependent receptor [Sphingobacterium lumbrici]